MVVEWCKIGYPVGKHTDQVTWYSSPMAAPGLAARLINLAMDKAPYHWVPEVEVEGTEGMGLLLGLVPLLLCSTPTIGQHSLHRRGLLIYQLPTGCTYIDWLCLRGL